MFGLDIVILWAIVIVAGVLIYVTLDGFDLGVGMLFPFVGSKEERDIMMNSIASIWDGNETWMVLGGAGLFAAFPLAYSVILSALYLPVIFMVLGLVFRGVSFEYRARATDEKKHIWDKSFALGSLVATFFQGVIAGSVVSGFTIVDRQYVGGAWDWITAFNVLAGVGLVVVYALLGSTWLIKKTENHLQQRMRELTRVITVLLLISVVALFVWTFISQEKIAENWMAGSHPYILAIIAGLLVLSVYFIFRAIADRSSHYAPFVITLGVLVLGFITLGISIWPNVLPPDISIWEAAAPYSSLRFSLIGVLIFLPIIVIYTSWSYYIFHGKVRTGEGEGY